MVWIGLLLCGVAFGQSTYTIKPGDSLAKIARKHGCTTEELAKANGLKLTTIIHPGQKLKVPGKSGGAQDASNPAVSADGTHTVQAGDTFAAISRRYGMSLDSLLAANPGVDPKSLRPGQKVNLAAPAPAPVATTSQPADAPAEETVAPAADEADNEPASSETASAPAGEPETAEATAPPAATEGKIITVAVENEMTFGEFAAQHGTDVARLNELNGLQLESATVLAKGSELYVPAQP